MTRRDGRGHGCAVGGPFMTPGKAEEDNLGVLVVMKRFAEHAFRGDFHGFEHVRRD